MTTFAFTKGHGTGNDFVLVADPDGELDLTPAQVAALCDRHFGVGGDGLLRAVRSSRIEAGASALGEDPDAEWFMDYRNADGTVAEMCGNGIRVFVHFLLDQGLIQLPFGQSAAIGTRGGVRDVQRSASGYTVDLGRWRLEPGDSLVQVKGLPVARPAVGITIPNPHVVLAVADESELERAELAYIPIVEPERPDGTNVELVLPSDPLVTDGVGSIRMRVHERGVGETLSCGTGAAAAALATRHWAGEGAPNQWRVEVPGGVVGVRMFPTEDGEHVSLTGPAELVFTGSATV